MRLEFNVIDFIFLVVQLNCHDTGREKDFLPRVGQRNMMNKVFHQMHLLLFKLLNLQVLIVDSSTGVMWLHCH